MRILVVSQYFWPESFRINEIVHFLKVLGHEVEVVTGKPNYPEGRFFSGYSGLGIVEDIWKGIRIHRIPILARGSKSSLRLVFNYFSFIISGLIFAPWIFRKDNYDVIFVYGVSPIFQSIPASFLGWVKGVPVVLWVQDLWPQSVSATGHIQSKFLLKLLEKMVSYTYKHTDFILAQSKAFIPHIKYLCPLQIPVKYLPNSVDDAFLTSTYLQSLSEKQLKAEFSVVFAGNVGAAQAIGTIVDAAEKLRLHPKIKFVVFGQGSKLEWLKAEIANKKLDNIYLAGHRPIEDMPQLLKQASVLLVTLAKQPIFALTIPSKIQAYLAAGRPIVACLDGEGAKVIQDASAGLTVPAENADLLAQAILKLYSSSVEDLEQMGRNGQHYFKVHFKHDLVMNSLVSYLEEAIHQYKR